MSESAIRWVAVIGAFVTAALFATEILRWRNLADVITRRQKVLRVVLVVLILWLLGMMYCGPYITATKDPVRQILYWMMCVVLAMGVVVVALFDVRETVRGYAQLRRDALKQSRGREEWPKT